MKDGLTPFEIEAVGVTDSEDDNVVDAVEVAVGVSELVAVLEIV